MGQPYSPSGFGHTIIFDVNHQKARPLSWLECWLIDGGADSVYYNLSRAYLEQAILTSTTPAIQLFLLQLTFGTLGMTSEEGENKELGGPTAAKTNLGATTSDLLGEPNCQMEITKINHISERKGGSPWRVGGLWCKG